MRFPSFLLFAALMLVAPIYSHANDRASTKATEMVAPTPLTQDAFDRRMAGAQEWEDTADGKVYFDVLYGAIGNELASLMTRCFPIDGERLDQFQYVADLTADRSIDKAEFRPDTAATRCFAEGFPKLPFPSLPAFAHDRLPIAMKVTIKP